MAEPRMPDQDTNLKVLEGMVGATPRGTWMVGGSNIDSLFDDLLGMRIKVTIEVLPDGG